MRHSETVGNLQSPAHKVQSGTMSGLSPHFQFLPGHAMLNTGSQGLRSRLLCGKTGSKTLGKVLFPAAESNFLSSKNFLQKAVSIAGNGLRNSSDFHNVDSGADQHECFFPLLHVSTEVTNARQSSIPKSSKVTMKIPLFSSDHGKCVRRRRTRGLGPPADRNLRGRSATPHALSHRRSAQLRRMGPLPQPARLRYRRDQL